ncbi:MAG TPA: VCBS repeat-containing protein [Kofleriaceae bacterium]|nr:VCBS repeat-containing protein [Kofleriaceae bacterium]
MRRLALAVVVACQQNGGGEATQLARRDVTSWVGGAERAAIGDLTGDGKAEIALADANRLRVVDSTGRELASIDALAGIQVLEIARGLVLAGWGESRAHRGAHARISAYRLDGAKLIESVIAEPETARAEVTAIVPAPDGAVLVAYYDSKYIVHSALARQAPGGAWTLTDVASIRMAVGYAYAGRELAVARVYGDDLHVDGDAFILHADGTRAAIPTTRGARAIAAGDSDGDGKPELFLADGWHENYAQLARGLVTWAHLDGSAPHAELIEDLAGEYTAGKLVAADLDGDGKVELVSNGNKYVRVFKRSGAGWTGETLGGPARDVAVGALDGERGASILIVGDKSELVRAK